MSVSVSLRWLFMQAKYFWRLADSLIPVEVNRVGIQRKDFGLMLWIDRIFATPGTEKPKQHGIFCFVNNTSRSKVRDARVPESQWFTQYACKFFCKEMSKNIPKEQNTFASNRNNWSKNDVYSETLHYSWIPSLFLCLNWS